MGFTKRLTCVAVIALATASPLAAAEYAVLHTGFRLRAERHEVMGDKIRLHTLGGGWMDLEASQVDRFEAEDYVPPPAPAVPAAPTLDQIIETSSARHGLDPDLIRSVIRAESAWNQRAVSRKGAAGLMQLMPGTARDHRLTDVFDPAQNVEAGTSYLRRLLGQFGNDLGLALAAYNAGPKKVEAYRGLPPYMETRAYVNRVIRLFNQSKTKN